MSNKLTKQDVIEAAKSINVPYSALQAVLDVECRGSGFFSTGEPAILFERHVFWRRLGAIRWFTWRLKIMAKHPRICNPVSGGYGRYSEQHKKLGIAAKYNRDVALESASWGIGQVMGYHWQKLGYDSLQSFINDMYANEVKQLDAVLRYIKVNDLVQPMQRRDWHTVARVYNGPKYRKNNYDEKLRQADFSHRN